MKSFKAVSIREPWASRIAAGEDTCAFKGTRTSYRGPIVVVSADEPTYARAIANLIDVRPISGEEDAPIRRGFVWEFGDVKRIALCPVKPKPGLFTVHLPQGALPLDEQTQAAAPTAKPPAEYDGAKVKVTVAENVSTARSALCRAAGGMRAIAAASAESAEVVGLEQVQEALGRLRIGFDQLIDGMIKGNALWSDQLSPWVNGAEWPPSPPTPLTPEHRRGKRLDVLVVDDEPVLLRGLARMLSVRHDVRTASSKSEARTRILERTPDVLVCDYQLEWQSSEDLLAEIRDSYPMVRRVLYSFSRIEVWCNLLQRKLIDAAVPKSAPATQLLDAIG